MPIFSGTPHRSPDPLVFTKEGNEAQRDPVTYLRSHIPEEAEPWLRPESFALTRVFPPHGGCGKESHQPKHHPWQHVLGPCVPVSHEKGTGAPPPVSSSSSWCCFSTCWAHTLAKKKVPIRLKPEPSEPRLVLSSIQQTPGFAS